MKLLIVASLALVAIAYAAPVEKEEVVTVAKSVAKSVAAPFAVIPKILAYEFVKVADGSYKFNYKSEDGSERVESASLKEVQDPEDEKLTKVILTVRGSYIQNDIEGNPHVMNYEADENGYRVTGDLVPVIQSS